MKHNLSELEKKLALLVGRFEHVFETDWQHTRSCLMNPDSFISSDGDFLCPGSFDEGDNWDSYRCLLESYRELVEVMLRQDIHPALDESDFLEAE